jgi:hypothetical protein
MCPCHECHTRTRLQGQLRNVPLLRQSSPSANRPWSTYLPLITHDDIVVLKPGVMPEGDSGRLPKCGRCGQRTARSFEAVHLDRRQRLSGME